ncbi:unnamed protein product [Candida parapsilosis]
MSNVKCQMSNVKRKPSGKKVHPRIPLNYILCRENSCKRGIYSKQQSKKTNVLIVFFIELFLKLFWKKVSKHLKFRISNFTMYDLYK